MDFAVFFSFLNCFFFFFGFFVRWHPKSFLLQRFEAAFLSLNIPRSLDFIDQNFRDLDFTGENTIGVAIEKTPKMFGRKPDG